MFLINGAVCVKGLEKAYIYKEECNKHLKAIWAEAYLYFSQKVERFNTPFFVIYTMEILSRELMRLKECVEKR